MQIRTEHGLRDPEALKLIGDHYLNLKKTDGSYRRIADRVQVAEIGNGEARYSLEIGWPKLATPGSYQVEVYACRDGRIVGQSGTTLSLTEIGFPAFMANAAREHPYGYGILAVILAVIAGFGIDALAVLLGGAKKRSTRRGAPATTASASIAHYGGSGRRGWCTGAGAGRWRTTLAPCPSKPCNGSVGRLGCDAQQRPGALIASGDAGVRRIGDVSCGALVCPKPRNHGACRGPSGGPAHDYNQR